MNKMSQYAIVVEADRCIGCKGGCQIACKTENDISLGRARSTLYTMGPTGDFPNLQMYFLPVMCQQCKNPACVRVCPTGACYKSDDDGVIYIDQDVCIGCRGCQNACPFHCNNYNPEMRVMDKCTLCVQRRQNGDIPACVKNCAGGALHFGDIDDAESEVSKLLEENKEYVHTLKDVTGNQPGGRFILRHNDWIDMLPYQFEKAIAEGKIK